MPHIRGRDHKFHPHVKGERCLRCKPLPRSERTIHDIDLPSTPRKPALRWTPDAAQNLMKTSHLTKTKRTRKLLDLVGWRTKKQDTPERKADESVPRTSASAPGSS